MKDCAAHNRIYRVIWNRARGVWMVVGELASGLGKGSGRKRHSLRGLLLLIPLSLFSTAAMAAPTGGTVTSGTGTISQSGATTTINQSSQNLSLSWKTFNVSSSETVNFDQPNSSAVAVNRIYDTNGSQIMGHLNANGNIYLINPNGILFGASAQVNVGGLVASTLNIGDASLSSSNQTFSGSGTGSVVNEGSITASHYVALLGNSVTNSGVITAQLGTVAMGAGDNVSLTFSGNSLVKLTVNQSVVNSLVANHGLVKANGGLVIMNAGARDTLLASVVNNDGVVEAQTVSNHNGTIQLMGGMAAGTVNVGGTLDASAPNGGNGGSIETSGAYVNIADGATITAASSSGNGGSWLIDPVDLTIGTSAATAIGTALNAGTSVTEQTTATGTSNSGSTNAGSTNSGLGDINVDASISWTTGNATLTLSAYHSLNINAPITATSSSGKLVLVTNNNVGGTSSGGTLNIAAPVDLNAASKLSINGTNYTIIDSISALQAIGSNSTNLTGHYALAANLNDSNAAFTPIEISQTSGGHPIPPIAFTGTFEGLGHSISNLYINKSSTNMWAVGLFGAVGTNGVVRDVGLVGGSVSAGTLNNLGELVGSNAGTIINVYATGSVSVATASYASGDLVGSNKGTITDAYATGNVSGTNMVGGLVGYNSNGTISNAYATGAVSGTGSDVGGLVGGNHAGTIGNAYATGAVSGTYDAGGLVGYNSASSTISNAYATGAVSGTYDLGGLVGYNQGTISNTYATGSVTGSSNLVGGLVGSSTGTISDAYATGSVSGTTNVGGLVGASSGTISNAYWDTTTGISTGIGGGIGGSTTTETFTGTQTTGGLSTTALSSNLSALGFSTSTWANAGNQTTPYLLANASFRTVSGNVILGSDGSTTPTYYKVIQNLTQLQNINTTGLTDNYVLATNIDAKATSTNTATWGTNGFTPIGDGTIAFTGLFEGLNHTISGLYINRPLTGFVGLFGSMGTGSIVRNVGVIGGSITGEYGVGGLVGDNSGTISNAYATGSVSAGGTNVGGLVGYNHGTITGAYATGSVSSGGTNTGGLVGSNSGTISNAYATGSVNGSIGTGVGGLVGASSGTISNAYATGSVSASGSNVGGLVGSNGGTISNGYWDTTTTGKATNAGYGVNGGNGGTITGGGGLTTAQLAAALPTGFTTSNWANAGNQTTPYLKANETFSTVSGNVILGSDTSTNAPTYGVIDNMTQLQNINSTGLSGNYVLGTNLTDTVTTGSGFTPIGNLTTKFTGVFDGLNHIITGLYINRPSTNYVGLFGAVHGGAIVRNVGLVGGSVSGNFTGGLVGWNAGTISDAYATGNVGVSGSYVVGGLVGYSTGTVSSSYATGSVSGNGSNVGGLVGHNAGTISNSYATGTVSGSGNAGGLVGRNIGTITNGYWDSSATATGVGSGSATGATGLTDTQMQQSSNFSGFDFTNTWVQYDGHTDPLLRVFMTPLTVTSGAQSKTYDGTSTVSLNSPTYSVTGADTSGHLFGLSSAYGTNAINAGSYSSDLWSDQQGYIINQTGVGTLTINPAPLTVTANNAIKFYDGTAYSGGNGVSYMGFVHGEGISVLGGSLSYGGSAQGAVNAGSYAITPGGYTSGNYAISFVNGVLTISSGTAPQDVVNVRVNDQALLIGATQGQPNPDPNIPGQNQPVSGKQQLLIPSVSSLPFTISGTTSYQVQPPGVHLPSGSLYLGDDGKKPI